MTITAPSVEKAPLPKIAMRDTILIWAFVNALTFDFKPRETGGNPIQLAMVAFAFLTGAIILAQDKKFKPYRATACALGFFVFVLALNFLNIGIATFQQPEGFDLINSIRNSASLMLMPLGLAVAHSLARRGFPVSALGPAIAFSGLASAVFRFIYGRSALATDVAEATRWEVLSPLTFILVGFGVVGLLYSRKFDWLGAACFGTFVFINLASATRSLTLGLGTAVILVPLLLICSGRLKDPRFVQRLGIGAASVVAVGLVSVALLQMYRSDGINGLLNRDTSSQFVDPKGNPHDATVMLREAQLEGMKHNLKESPYALVFGRGVAVPYSPDRYYEGTVPFYLFPTDPATFSDLGLAYMIFTSGLLVGGLSVLFMFGIPILGCAVAGKLSKMGNELESVATARASLAVAAFFGLNITWAGTYERPAMLMFGLLSGIVLVSWDRIRLSERARKRSAVIAPDEMILQRAGFAP